MDFNQLAHYLVGEAKAAGVSHRFIAQRLGITRQAFARRLNTNSLTTEDLTRIAALSVTFVGGSVLMDWINITQDSSHGEKGGI